MTLVTVAIRRPQQQHQRLGESGRAAAGAVEEVYCLDAEDVREVAATFSLKDVSQKLLCNAQWRGVP